MTSVEPSPSAAGDFHILDLFAGPGGLDVAAHFLGVKSHGVEWDGNACETRYAAGLPTFHADVREFREKRWHELPSGINVLAGGPPCQTYSVAGHGRGRKALDLVQTFIKRITHGESDEEIDAALEELSPNDPRTGLVLEPLRWLVKLLRTRSDQPIKAIVLEQVPAVELVWHSYAEVLRGGELPHGVKYEVAVGTLRTEEYGVPQTRKRAVLIARLAGSGPVRLPDPTHLPFTRRAGETAKPSSGTGQAMIDAGWHVGRKPCRTMRDALPKRPREFTVVSNYGQGGDPKARGRREASEPAFTVTGKVSRNAVLVDGREDVPPRLTIPEAGILQTFPADYPWSGRDQSQQVGNAVPPLFGMHVINAALGLGKAVTYKSVSSRRSPAEQRELRRKGCEDCPVDHTSPVRPPGSDL